MKILCFDIGGTAIKYGVVQENGKVINNKEIPTEAHLGGHKVMEKVLNIIARYDGIERIGISTTGQVNSHTGEIIFASKNIPEWTGIPIKKIIEEKYKIFTIVENDVKCAAIAEAYFGAAKEYEKFLCLTYGTGVGGAIIQNKKVYRDLGYSAGQFGHMIIYANGEKCNCGLRGCYERYASTAALVRKVKEELGFGQESDINGRFIFDKIKKEDKDYIDIVSRWLEDVMVGLANLIHIFNPKMVILGGGVMQEQYVVKYIAENIDKKIIPSFIGVKIIPASLGNKAGLIGIAKIASIE